MHSAFYVHTVVAVLFLFFYLFLFIERAMCSPEKYHLKITIVIKKIYFSVRSGQIHGEWHLMLRNVTHSASLIVSHV